MDQHLWLKALSFHGPSLLNTVVNDVHNDSKNISKKQKIHNFIRNNHSLLFTERPSVNINSSNFKPLPLELFWNSSHDQRRRLFFKNLERGDILILKVVNVSLQDSYKLQVLAKHRCCMKLDDLSLIMFLPKLQPEMDIVGGVLNNYDVIRAAVCSCSINERKLFVTLDNTILDEDAEPIKLGKIDSSEFPSYVGEIQVQHSSFKAYYHQTAAFDDPNWSNQLHDILGLKKNYLYSFHKNWDGKEYPVTESGQYLKTKHLCMVSNLHYSKAVEYYEAQNFAQAIVSLNQALAIYPQNKKALVSRGTLYANSKNLRKAFIDTEEALKLDPFYEPARKQMSVLLVNAAKTHIQTNDLAAAKESLSAAISLDEHNEEAAAELIKLEKEKEKVSEAAMNSSFSSDATTTTTKSKKKKKKHSRDKSDRSREKSEKRNLHHHKSKSPKKKKEIQSVVKKVGKH